MSPEKRLEQIRYNKRLQTVLLNRVKLKRILDEGDPDKIEHIRQMCKDNIVFAIDHFFNLYDPRETYGAKWIPFVLYDYQREDVVKIWDSIQNGGDVFLEKSRDMGATWLVCAVIIYGWDFWGYDFLVGSRKADMVDRSGDTTTLFHKLMTIQKGLPAVLAPKGFNSKVHRKRNIIENPDLGNAIMGEATNPEFSVGGRFKAILFDEFSKWDSRGFGLAEQCWNKARDATKCRMAVSTPDAYYGLETMFAQLKFSDAVQILKLRWHWTKHPFKDKAWYDNECARTPDPSYIAQELDINYERAVQGKVYPMFDEEKHVKDFEINPEWPISCSWDLSEGGDDPYAIIWAQKDPKTKTVYIFDEVSHQHTIDWIMPFFTGRIENDKDHVYSSDDLIHIKQLSKYKPKYHIGDPYSGAKRDNKKVKVVDELAALGVYLQIPRENTRVKDRIDAVTLLFRRIVVHPRCKGVIDALKLSRWPKPKNDSISSIKKPIHNKYSHYRTAVEYLAANEDYVFPIDDNIPTMPASGTVYVSRQNR